MSTHNQPPAPSFAFNGYNQHHRSYPPAPLIDLRYLGRLEADLTQTRDELRDSEKIKNYLLETLLTTTHQDTSDIPRLQNQLASVARENAQLKAQLASTKQRSRTLTKRIKLILSCVQMGRCSHTHVNNCHAQSPGSSTNIQKEDLLDLSDDLAEGRQECNSASSIHISESGSAGWKSILQPIPASLQKAAPPKLRLAEPAYVRYRFSNVSSTKEQLPIHRIPPTKEHPSDISSKTETSFKEKMTEPNSESVNVRLGVISPRWAAAQGEIPMYATRWELPVAYNAQTHYAYQQSNNGVNFCEDPQRVTLERQRILKSEYIRMRDYFKYGISYKPHPTEPDVFRTIIIDQLPPGITLKKVMERVRGGPIVSCELLDTTRISQGMTAMIIFVRQSDASHFSQYVAAHPLEFLGKTARVTHLRSSPTKPTRFPVDKAIKELKRTRCLLCLGLTHGDQHDRAVEAILDIPQMKHDGVQVIERQGPFLKIIFDTVDAAIAAHTRLCISTQFRDCEFSFAPDPCDQPCISDAQHRVISAKDITKESRDIDINPGQIPTNSNRGTPPKLGALQYIVGKAENVQDPGNIRCSV